jgi:3-hydroxyacyl-[acyl-carrier-protein] dehydratase
MIGREDIKKVLPHREPFLLIDEILKVEVGKSATAVWHVREDYDIFRGHFPGNPVLPGVLMVEALAQTGAYAILLDEKFRGKLALFGGIDGVKFRGLVRPGDDLVLEAELTRISSFGGKAQARASVDGKTVCEGGILFAFAKE